MIDLALFSRNRIVPVTYRVEPGQSMLLGGLARLDHVGKLPFLFTAYTSRNVSVHITKTTNVERILTERVGKVVYPPSVNSDALPLLANPCRASFTIEGHGWKKSSRDVVFDGIGWVSFTGSMDIRVNAYGSSAIHDRPALMPFDARSTSRKFFG